MILPSLTAYMYLLTSLPSFLSLFFLAYSHFISISFFLSFFIIFSLPDFRPLFLIIFIAFFHSFFSFFLPCLFLFHIFIPDFSSFRKSYSMKNVVSRQLLSISGATDSVNKGEYNI